MCSDAALEISEIVRMGNARSRCILRQQIAKRLT